ncbi:PepSY domain-containing protein [Labedella endophytica]|uniref:Uncharacterized protein n=1 Tax=Labedella endophytica TaxID=1523160 RepID=A0A433JRJ1_9MICO|nr:PepSY domain-containing protein [Labedella endophytica]RUR00906.1 hypothetical protein ELQ94_05005 [Labedella endophytica]
MNTNSDLPENRPQDSSSTAPSGQTAPTERLDDPTTNSATTTQQAPRRRISKRTWIIGGAVAGVLALGGAGFAIADELTDGSDALDDATRDRVASSALAYTGSGEFVSAERDDDGGYDAEVRLTDGTEVDLDLDDDFTVIRSDADRDDDRTGDDSNGNGDGGADVDRDDDDGLTDDDGTTDQGSGDDGTTTPGSGNDDDIPLTAAETTAATDAALSETGGGEVVDIDRSDDRDHAFEVEVRLPDGSEVEVDLDADFGVVTTSPSD